MNVLLTHGYFLKEDAREQKIMRPYPPLGVLYISAYLEAHGISNEVYDTTFKSRQELFAYFDSHLPSIVGIYTNLMTKVTVLQVIKYIKEKLPSTTIILGGPDVRHNAENYLRAGADFIVRGEGEETMLELVGSLIKNQPYDRCAGISFLKNDLVIEHPEREKIDDLDTLPLPARDKIDLLAYLTTWKQYHGTNTISVSTMRGCPYTCKWCSRGVYGLSYRRRSPKIVVEELAEIQRKYKPDSIWFVDDVFTISHKWLNGFQLELKRQNVSINYECITRADRMNNEVVEMLRDTGCFRVWIGAESGSQKVIDLMDRRVRVSQVRDMIHLSKAKGIETGTFIMLGYPGETESDIEETINHLKDSSPDHFTITLAYPIKGTELYEETDSIQIRGDWAASTDREIDFKRPYNKAFYQFAVRRVVNEVNYHKSKQKRFELSTAGFKFKSLVAKAGMRYHQFINAGR